MSLLSAQRNFPRACIIGRGYFCKPQEGREGEKLASANQTQKNYNHFWGWPLTTAALSQNLLLLLSVYTSW